jgi:hypothetical protein
VTSYDALSKGERAAAAITDPPYNVRIDGHVSGKLRTATERLLRRPDLTEDLTEELTNEPVRQGLRDWARTPT